MIYRCVESFELPFSDEDGSPTNGWGTVVRDSLWELNKGAHCITGAQVHLEQVNNECHDFSWIEISYETLTRWFELESEDKRWINT